jgi:S1-C subfamily serine protease
LPASLDAASGTSHHGEYLPIEQDVISVFKTISPYVVNVNTGVQPAVSAWQLDNLYTGSGFLWNDRGYVVTNYHVIKYGKNFSVTFSKDVTVKAKLIGFDKRSDVAVLRLVSTKQLPKAINGSQIPLGKSNRLQVGQIAIAIGNPYGLDKTLTTGVISALDRNLPELDSYSGEGMIQTDASVNPGNSGGPLLDSQGRLIGMNTMIVSRTGASSGIAFAIPVDTIKNVVTQIIRYGKFLRPSIGVNTLNDYMAASVTLQGVIINDVVPGSPAAKAGLRGLYTKRDGSIGIGDVIVGMGDYRINNLTEYYYLLDRKKLGDSVLLTYYRNGKLRKATLKVVKE